MDVLAVDQAAAELLFHHVNVFHRAPSVWQREPDIAITARLDDAVFPQRLRRA
jgi:hypothetical protein